MVLTGLEVFLALYMSKRSILGLKTWVMGPQEHSIQHYEMKMLSKSSYQLQNMVLTGFFSIWGSLRISGDFEGFWTKPI